MIFEFTIGWYRSQTSTAGMMNTYGSRAPQVTNDVVMDGGDAYNHYDQLTNATFFFGWVSPDLFNQAGGDLTACLQNRFVRSTLNDWTRTARTTDTDRKHIIITKTRRLKLGLKNKINLRMKRKIQWFDSGDSGVNVFSWASITSWIPFWGIRCDSISSDQAFRLIYASRLRLYYNDN